MDYQKNKKLKQFYNSLLSQKPIFDEWSGMNIDASPVKLLSLEIERLDREFPNLIPPFIMSNYFSHSHDGTNYYKVSGLRSYIASVIAILKTDIELIEESSYQQSTTKDKKASVFLGHGRSKLWARLKIFIEDELHVKTVAYESESRTSESIIPILERMLNESSFAIVVLTAEDVTKDGLKRARQNAVHEVGLFQGRLGFKKVVLLLQEGTEGFSNIDGLQYIPFPSDNIEQSFYELQRVLRRENQLL